MYVIKLENTVTHQIYQYEVNDNNEGRKLFYEFNVNTLELVDGEYLLTLYDEDGNVLSEDVLKIGDYKPNTLQYSKGDNTYIAIELDAKLGHKDAIIEDYNTVIYPNDGYDGMTDVSVDAYPVYERGKNDGYSDGYNAGNGDGYIQGSQEGYNQGYQKGYDNGERDGYGNGYMSGYDAAGSDVAETAQILEITKNGIYGTKYTPTVYPTLVTGTYDDGTDFYSYAKVKGSVYNTNITTTIDTKIKLWVNLNIDSMGDGYYVLFGNSVKEYNFNYFLLRYHNIERKLQATISNSDLFFDVPQGWCTIEMSIADGLWVNGEKLGDFTNIVDIDETPIYLNGTPNAISRNINGQFGMVKINDNVIIPTNEGFYNQTLSTYLEEVVSNSYEYVEVLPKVFDGNLIKTINVNVPPRISVQENNIKLSYSTFSTVPECFDFEGIENASNMFRECRQLIEAPYIDLTTVKDVSYMFQYCVGLKTIPQYNTQSVKEWNYFLGYCENLESLPPLDVSNASSLNYFLYVLSSKEFSKLTDVGGFQGLRINWSATSGLNKCPNLSYESCINILNGLYDFISNGESTRCTLKVHQNFLNLVGDEIAIGTNKGWTITA